MPLYEKYGVDLVLQRHDHIYSPSFNLRGGKPAPFGTRGIAYTISVSGPKNLRLTAYTLDGAIVAQIRAEEVDCPQRRSAHTELRA